MDLSSLTIDALKKESQAKEAKALAILQNYFANSAGIGEHPDIVEECSKQLKDLAEARENLKLLAQLTQPGEAQDGE